MAERKFTSSSLSPLFEKVEKLTNLQRILIYAGTLVLIVGAFIYFYYLPKYKEISRVEKEKQTLEKKLQTAKINAQQLAQKRAEMKLAEEAFNIAKSKLPEKEEIPSLLTNISQSGQNAGLEFLLFQPKAEVRKDFYAEIPVAIEVIGNYHNVAVFFDRVTSLSRIVHVENIAMKPIDDRSKGRKNAAVKTKNDELMTSCTAVTYKFVEPEVAAKEKGKGTPAKKK